MRKIIGFISSNIEFIAFGGPTIISVIAGMIFFCFSVLSGFQDIESIFYTAICILGSVLFWIIYHVNQKNIKKDYSSREHKYWYSAISLGGILVVLITLIALKVSIDLKIFPVLYGEKDLINLELLLQYLPLYFQSLMFLLAVVAFVLAYLNFNRKHGSALSGNFSYDYSIQEVPYIKEINIYNEKDRTTSIFSINLILNKKTTIKIIEYKPNPLTISAFTLKKIELLPVFKYSNINTYPDFSLDKIKIECLTETGSVIIGNKGFSKIVESEALRLPLDIPNVPLDSTHLVKFLNIDNYIPVKLINAHFIITNFCNDESIRCLEKIKLSQMLIKKLDEGTDINFELKGLYIRQVEELKKCSYSHGIDPEFMEILELPLTSYESCNDHLDRL